MKRFVACVAVWQGLRPKANSGWVVIDGKRMRILDGKGRTLAEAPVASVRYARTRFAMGATSVWVGEQRFMLSAGGRAGVPDDLADVPDLSGHVESAELLQLALERAGAQRARGKGSGAAAPPSSAPPPGPLEGDPLDRILAHMDDPVVSLISGASEGSKRQVKRALRAGAHIDAQDPVDRSGYTALHTAAVRGHLELVSYLLLEGASPNAVDRDGNTALFVALMSSSDDERAVEIGRMLLDAGADPRQPNAWGTSVADLDLPITRALFGGQAGG
ncbi:ankyrin repeat domain-containing protein [Jatrophihabitans fulvus]